MERKIAYFSVTPKSRLQLVKFYCQIWHKGRREAVRAIIEMDTHFIINNKNGADYLIGERSELWNSKDTTFYN